MYVQISQGLSYVMMAADLMVGKDIQYMHIFSEYTVRK